MFSKIKSFIGIDDALAATGLVIFLTGLYLCLGLAAALMVLGLVLIYAGVRLEPGARNSNESNQTINSNEP